MSALTRLRFRFSRRRAQAYAALNGYFWLPCPLCGTHFGGHEWRDDHGIPSGDNQQQAICPPCGDDLARQAAALCVKHGHTYGEVYDIPLFTRRTGSGIEANGVIDLNRRPDRVRCTNCLKPLPRQDVA